MASLLTDSDRMQILDMIDQGMSRNDIVRATGRGSGTVSKIAAEHGRTFDRTSTKAATRARQADLEADRLALAEELLSDARMMRRQLWEPSVTKQAMVVGDGGGAAHVETVEIAHPEPPFSDKQRIMTSVGIATDKVLAISKHDVKADEGGEQSMLVQLVDTLREAHSAPQPEAD